MTRDSEPVSDAEDPSVIARELAALGELPVEPEELGFHLGGAELDGDIDVATVATLISISAAEPDTRPRLELEHRRTWNRVADRLGSAGFRVTAAVGSRSVWRSVVAGLAMAASVAIVPRIVGDGPAANVRPPSSAAEAESMGSAAKRGLQALGDEYDTKRAQSVLSSYAARLQEGNDRR